MLCFHAQALRAQRLPSFSAPTPLPLPNPPSSGVSSAETASHSDLSHQLPPNLAKRHPGCKPLPTFQPELLPRLSHEEWSRGNAREYASGKRVSITLESTDRMKPKGRGQRPGLLYDPLHTGFEPTLEPHVLMAPCDGREGHHRYLLESRVVGSEAAILDVSYPTKVDDRLFEVGEGWLGQHGTVRGEDWGEGSMSALGGRRGYDGFAHEFKVKDPAKVREVKNGMFVAGTAFVRHFGGRDVGFEQLINLQGSLWPVATPPYPLCWNVSRDLANAAHCGRDATPSFAVWLEKSPGASGVCFLLFPRHGVAIQIVHGTWIRWDGSMCEHCTMVPGRGLGNSFISLFAAMPANLHQVLHAIVLA